MRAAFQKTDSSFSRFFAIDRRSIDPNRAVMIVTAGRPGREGQQTIGVFIVAGASNRVVQVVDQFPEDELQGFPHIGEADTDSIVLHFRSDYEIYYSSVKYFYAQGPVRKFRYGMVALQKAAVRNGRIFYRGEARDHGYDVTITPSAGIIPAYTITETSPSSDSPAPPVVFSLTGGQSARVMNTPVGQTHQPSGFAITGRTGGQEFFPAPVPTMELNRKLRASEQAPAEIENDVGPAARDGSAIWYANQFYDGEGFSGVGAVGEFDLSTHKYQMHYFPEIARWSGSALRIDGDDLWIGLMRQPEGAPFSGGLLRYNRRTGVAAKFDVPDYINTIDRVGDGIYCGTSNGLWVIRGGAVTHLAFEPDRGGRLTAVTRSLPVAAR